MNVCVIGAGYVGLTTAAVLSSLGHRVSCIDQDKKKVTMLQAGRIPIYEPGLQDLIEENKNRLRFSDDLAAGINQAEIIVLAVGTPSLPDGSSNLSFLYKALADAAANIAAYKVILIKSTVPPGTNRAVLNSLREKGYGPDLLDIVSNPEFLREGSALKDMLFPDRMVYGLFEENERVLQLLKQLYAGIDAPELVTNYEGAELIKYASNAFLAAKISFINEISRVCEKYGADITHVARGIGLDNRIGPAFLQAGIGYGGSCFPKDLQSLSYTAKSSGLEPLILDAVQSVNASQLTVYIEKLKSLVPAFPAVKTAVLGIAFKPETDDIRESPAAALIHALNKAGCEVSAFDPKASLPEHLSGVKQTSNPYDAVTGADVVILATDWQEIKNLDWQRVKQLMKGETLLDARNCLVPEVIRAAGLIYEGVGRL